MIMEYIQNRTKWCWAVACKMLGERYKENHAEFSFHPMNGRKEIRTHCLDGLRTDVVKMQNGAYLVDTWQYAIAAHADPLHRGMEGNFPGDDYMKIRGIKYAVTGDCESTLVQAVTLGRYDAADSLLHNYCKEIEEVFEKGEYLIGNAVLYPGGICHSFVLLEWRHDGSILVYDPWDGSIRAYRPEEVFYTGFPSLQGKGVLKWIQYIV